MHLHPVAQGRIREVRLRIFLFVSIDSIQGSRCLFTLFKAKELLSCKFPMCKKEKYVAPVCCGLMSILHGLGGEFGPCLLWVEWTPMFLQLFDFPYWSGFSSKDAVELFLALCNETNSQLIAGCSTNIKMLLWYLRLKVPKGWDIWAKCSWERGETKEQEHVCEI